GENIFLWGLRYKPEGAMFELWQENALLIKPDIDDKLEALPSFLQFFWSLKHLITESAINFGQLRKENNERALKSTLSNTTLHSSFSTVVNSSILKLIEDEVKAGFHVLGP
ncbi:MAG: hypothetical protein EXX96DRAFT_457602, partial [Benjaminiella poitrasii]